MSRLVKWRKGGPSNRGAGCRVHTATALNGDQLEAWKSKNANTYESTAKRSGGQIEDIYYHGRGLRTMRSAKRKAIAASLGRRDE